MKKISRLFIACMTIGVLASCNNDDDSSNNQTARVMVSMTDAPGDYEAVYVDVQDVQINTSAMTNGTEDGWVSLAGVDKGVYNLLDLTGGVTQLLADADVEAGYLSQIRLILGTDNSVLINGESQPLSTPSAQQSGLKLQVNQDLVAGETYAFLMDFDVDKSVVTAGSSGGFILKPVIRLTATANTGIIMGSIHPTTFQSLVKVTNAENSVSAYTNATGEFALNGVPAGIYQLTVTPDVAAGVSAKTINNVEVKSGETLNLETIFLE